MASPDSSVVPAYASRLSASGRGRRSSSSARRTAAPRAERPSSRWRSRRGHRHPDEERGDPGGRARDTSGLFAEDPEADAAEAQQHSGIPETVAPREPRRPYAGLDELRRSVLAEDVPPQSAALRRARLRRSVAVGADETSFRVGERERRLFLCRCRLPRPTFERLTISTHSSCVRPQSVSRHPSLEAGRVAAMPARSRPDPTLSRSS